MGRLADMLEEKGIDVETFAAAAHLYPNEVRDLINGTIPSWRDAEGIAEMLGVRVTDLWDQIRPYSGMKPQSAESMVADGITAKEFEANTWHEMISPPPHQLRTVDKVLNRMVHTAGINNDQLCRMTGLSVAVVNNITNGYSEPTRLQAEAICGAMNCSIANLFADPKNMDTLFPQIQREPIPAKLSDKRIGQNIHNHAIAQGITCLRLSTLLGVTPLTVDSMYRGSIPDDLSHICKVLHTSVNELCYEMQSDTVTTTLWKHLDSHYETSVLKIVECTGISKSVLRRIVNGEALPTEKQAKTVASHLKANIHRLFPVIRYTNVRTATREAVNRKCRLDTTGNIALRDAIATHTTMPRLANETGLLTSTIKDMVYCGRIPTKEQAGKIAEALGCSVSDLFKHIKVLPLKAMKP